MDYVFESINEINCFLLNLNVKFLLKSPFLTNLLNFRNSGIYELRTYMLLYTAFQHRLRAIFPQNENNK